MSFQLCPYYSVQFPEEINCLDNFFDFSFLDEYSKFVSNFEETCKKYSNRDLCKAEVEQILDAEFENTYQNFLENIKNKNIIILVPDLWIGGFGDFIFAVKISQIFKEKIQNVNVAIVIPIEEHLTKIKSILTDDSSEINNIYTYDTLPENFRNERGLCIGAAGFFNYRSKLFGFYYHSLNLKSDYECLSIPEYSCIQHQNIYYSKTKVPGLKRNEYGILIDKEISEIADKIKDEKKDPISFLEDLTDTQLKTDIKEDNVPITEYSKNTKLYFGYGHEIKSQIHFIRLVASLEKNNANNVDLVLILDIPNQLECFLHINITEELLEKGFTEIEIMPSEDNDQSYKILSDTFKKKLRIIPRKTISQKDFKTCIIMSQPFCLITGDQSFSEAVSANKYFIYELYQHKYLFNESVRDLANELKLFLVRQYLIDTAVPVLNFEFRAIARKWKFEFPLKKTSENYDETISKYLLNQDFISEWQKFIRYIKEERSLNKKIVSFVIKILAESSFPYLKLRPILRSTFH